MKTTELGNSYWASTGAYQTEYDQLYKELVPMSGVGETTNAELIRAISRLFYEYCNNGNCNAAEEEWTTQGEQCSVCVGCGYLGGDEDDECDECGGSGEVEEDVIIGTDVSPMYQDFLKLISEQVTGAEEFCDQITEFIEYTDHGASLSAKFDDRNMDKYNKVCDLVIYHVINTEDKPLPEWYLDNNRD